MLRTGRRVGKPYLREILSWVPYFEGEKGKCLRKSFTFGSEIQVLICQHAVKANYQESTRKLLILLKAPRAETLRKNVKGKQGSSGCAEKGKHFLPALKGVAQILPGKRGEVRDPQTKC